VPLALRSVAGVELLGSLRVAMGRALRFSGGSPALVSRLRTLLSRLRPALGHLRQPVRFRAGSLRLGVLAIGLPLLFLGLRALMACRLEMAVSLSAPRPRLDTGLLRRALAAGAHEEHADREQQQHYDDENDDESSTHFSRCSRMPRSATALGFRARDAG